MENRKNKTKIAVCQWCLKDQSPEGCARAAELGYDGVAMDFGLWYPQNDLRREGKLARYVNAFAEKGLRVPSLALNALQVRTPEEAETALKTVNRAVRAAVILGADILVIPCFGGMELNTPESFQRMTGFLQKVCGMAESAGLTVGAETSLPLEKDKELLQAVDRGNFRIYFDTANPVMMNFGDPIRMLEELLPQICEIHVKDFRDLFGKPRSVFLGHGKGKALEQLTKIRDSGYTGWIVTENTLPAKALAQDVQIIREIMG
ncbi:MAG: sugar phosphate isomerase/epimerase family protein [Lachnospiraceae bacterium]|jgi:sugar phosphate isomerase/epimerase